MTYVMLGALPPTPCKDPVARLRLRPRQGLDTLPPILAEGQGFR